jgi:hypothetical protein
MDFNGLSRYELDFRTMNTEEKNLDHGEVGSNQFLNAMSPPNVPFPQELPENGLANQAIAGSRALQAGSFLSIGQEHSPLGNISVGQIGLAAVAGALMSKIPGIVSSLADRFLRKPADNLAIKAFEKQVRELDREEFTSKKGHESFPQLKDRLSSYLVMKREELNQNYLKVSKKIYQSLRDEYDKLKKLVDLAEKTQVMRDSIKEGTVSDNQLRKMQKQLTTIKKNIEHIRLNSSIMESAPIIASLRSPSRAASASAASSPQASRSKFIGKI